MKYDQYDREGDTKENLVFAELRIDSWCCLFTKCYY